MSKALRQIFLDGALELARRGDVEAARGFVQVVQAQDRIDARRGGRKRGDVVAARRIPAEKVAECDAIEAATFADGTPVTDADRAEAGALCQCCLRAPARWLDGGWWDCDDCRERAEMDRPEYD